ncbi:MAG: TIGR01777 family protein [Spirulinaceae cyanobacterium SM2_1_0]|nr:TIGR01777 family protein [Spirulinaceae cyanobacterium SM2_1_0]
MKIAITGGTGFVGTRLVQKLQADDQDILVFTRDVVRSRRIFPAAAFPRVELVAYQPLAAGDWQTRISGCAAVVNLAGESLADGRWTPARKQAIIDSRQLGTRRLVEAIQQAEPKPQVLVSASAVGYYGTSETAVFTETSPPGDDFLAEICQTWEAEAQAVKAAGVRLAIARIGIVLGNGGAIAKLIPPFKLFAGGPIGSGQQWFSWIYRDDLVDLIWQMIQRPDFAGVYNATAPNPVRMQELCATLGQLLQRPSWLPVPAFAIEALLGDAAMIVLEGQRALPEATQAAGFQYQQATVKSALAAVLAET